MKKEYHSVFNRPSLSLTVGTKNDFSELLMRDFQNQLRLSNTVVWKYNPNYWFTYQPKNLGLTSNGIVWANNFCLIDPIYVFIVPTCKEWFFLQINFDISSSHSWPVFMKHLKASDILRSKWQKVNILPVIVFLKSYWGLKFANLAIWDT